MPVYSEQVPEGFLDMLSTNLLSKIAYVPLNFKGDKNIYFGFRSIEKSSKHAILAMLSRILVPVYLQRVPEGYLDQVSTILLSKIAYLPHSFREC